MFRRAPLVVIGGGHLFTLCFFDSHAIHHVLAHAHAQVQCVTTGAYTHSSGMFYIPFALSEMHLPSSSRDAANLKLCWNGASDAQTVPSYSSSADCLICFCADCMSL